MPGKLHGGSWLGASHGSVILSRGRLVAVESPGYPRHPSSIQHDAVVNVVVVINFAFDSDTVVSYKV